MLTNPKRYPLDLYHGPTILLGRLWPGDDDDGNLTGDPAGVADLEE